MTEAQIQKSIVDFLRAVLPPNFRVVAIPNGARRTSAGRASNAVAGLTPGAPDLVILGNSRAYLIEIKTKTGKLSDHQSEFATWAVTKGALAWCCARSLDDVRVALVEWGIPTREAKA